MTTVILAKTASNPKILNLKQDLDPFSRLYTAKLRERQTDRRPRYGIIDRSSPHLMHSMRPENNVAEAKHHIVTVHGAVIRREAGVHVPAAQAGSQVWSEIRRQLI